MKKIVLSILAVTTLFAVSCKKSSNNNSTSNVTEQDVINDFVNKIALPQYQALAEKGIALNAAIATLNTTTNATNLAAAQSAWRDTRTCWEQCEGFLFGPVEDNNYDPNMDTWPVDYHQLDSLLASTTMTTFTVNYVQSLNTTLRGFHPLEFILWGQQGTATAASITANEKQYMLALSADVQGITDSLNTSWATTGGNFQMQVLQAGGGSTRFTSKQAVLLAIVGAMSDICDEVGRQGTDGKIYDPYIAHDSTKTESPFSHNSMIDFKNNIMGAQNVYLCKYNGQTGSSLSAFVAARNLSLDNNIKAQFTAAIGALDNVSVNFETAIYTQRTQLLAAMNALNTLQATLDGNLKTFITTYVKD